MLTHLSLNPESLLADALQSPVWGQVRQRIFRQLLESLLFENLLTLKADDAHQDTPAFRIAAQAADGQPLSYRAEGKYQLGFNRPRLCQPVYRQGPDGEVEATCLSQFLLEAVLPEDTDQERLMAFIDELQRTLLNDAIAQFYRQQRSELIRNQPYEAIEFASIDGHPYHPCYKSRIGFSQTDAIAYSPDFQPQFSLLWVAVRSPHIRVCALASLSPQGFVQAQLGEADYGRFIQAIRQTGAEPEDYHLLPVHPWQWQQLAPQLVHPLATQDIILLGAGGDRYCPQQSIRTLANLDYPQKAYVKLPLSILNTSTSRILAPHTVDNAAKISTWLTDLWQQDSYLSRDLQLVMLREVLGMAYGSELSSGTVGSATRGSLGVIWRESLQPYLQANEQAIPFHALTYIDSDRRPLVDNWIRTWGLEAWVVQWLRVSVTPLIHWLYAHGIAFEAHGQNMILLHRDGWPVRIALRDFHDGIRFSRAHLGQPEQCPPLTATPAEHARVNRNSYLETHRAAEVRDFLLDAFWLINLSEMAWFFQQAYGLSEFWFWSQVAQVVLDYQARFPHLKARFQLFDVFAETLQVEQLTKRRLFLETEVRVQAVPNPLAAIRQAMEVSC